MTKTTRRALQFLINKWKMNGPGVATNELTGPDPARPVRGDRTNG